METQINAQKLSTEQLLADWLREFAATLTPPNGFVRIRRAEPRPQYHNFFSRFKVETAKLDGTGENPTNVTCLVVEVSETDQTAKAVTTTCDSLKDV